MTLRQMAIKIIETNGWQWMCMSMDEWTDSISEDRLPASKEGQLHEWLDRARVRVTFPKNPSNRS